MVHIPIENKIFSTKNAMEDLLTDFSHMVGEVNEEDEAHMQSILDGVYKAYLLMDKLEEKYR